MTAQQPYTVIQQREGYELRNYPAGWVIDATVVGKSFRKAGNVGFRPLLRYISGENVAGDRFEMTAPVFQQAWATTHTVTFVLPESAHDVAAALDPSVGVRRVPRETIAALRYSGSTGEKKYQLELAMLRAYLLIDGIEESGPPRLARYDPPWTPRFMRRNEVQIPVDWP